MRVLIDVYGRTITETAPDVWEIDGLRLDATGQTEQQVIDTFNMFAPATPEDEPLDE